MKKRYKQKDKQSYVKTQVNPQNVNRYKLVKSLSENTYKQGVEQLYHKNTDTYCILGVAADIYIKETNLAYWSTPDTGRYTYVIMYTDKDKTKYAITLPPQIADWYGFSHSYIKNLVDINDSGKDFNTIAKHIINTINDNTR